MKDRSILVHGLKDAKAAVAVASDLGVPVTLRSAPGAARTLGATVFRDMIQEAQRPHPGVAITAVFDCGDDPGLALGALRHGLKVIRVSVSGEVRERIADIAAQSGARLDEDGQDSGGEVGTAREPVLDLLDMDDPEAAVRSWLTEPGNTKER